MAHRPEQFGKVAVLMGGTSAEREISLMSGSAVLEALCRCGVDAHPFDPQDRSLCDLKHENFDRAFIVLHGRGGEDGTVQGLLESLQIPHTGSGVMASALCLDKWRTKLVWEAARIPTPRHVLLDKWVDQDKLVDDLGLPLIIKPVHEGSTIGLTKVEMSAQLPGAVELAKRYDEAVLAEEFIDGQELTAAILVDRPLPLVRIEAPQGNYDYHNKYFSDETKYLCPAGLPTEIEEQIQAVAMHAFGVLGCRGWGRADVMLRADGNFFFLEMNTVPGMTGHSLVPMAARQAGMGLDDLVLAILTDTLSTSRGGQP